MKKKTMKISMLIAILILALFAAGCGGGGGVQRIAGLSADWVVKTFFEAAKGGRLNEAGAYVSPSTASDPQVVIKYLAGQTGLGDLKSANLLSVRKVAEQGDYAVVVATLQAEQNSLKLSVRPVGLEKLNGEWYIVDLDKIYQDAKYRILQQLLTKI